MQAGISNLQELLQSACDMRPVLVPGCNELLVVFT